MALQSGSHCYCSDLRDFDRFGVRDNCTTECPGNSQQICGHQTTNGWTENISVYRTTAGRSFLLIIIIMS